MSKEELTMEQQRKQWTAFLKTPTGARHFERMNQRHDMLMTAAKNAETSDEQVKYFNQAIGVESEILNLERILGKPEVQLTRIDKVKEWIGGLNK